MSNPSELDQRYSWHPFTQMRDWCAREPLMLVEGDGAILRDSAGNEYLDGNSSIWTNLHGHRHPKINAAIRAQLDRVAHVSYLGSANEPASILAEKLVKLFPPGTLERVFYSDDGSTAIEVALKMAAQFWQLGGQPRRSIFVSFDQAYHGDTAGAASLGGISVFHDRFAKFHFPCRRVKTVAELRELPELRNGEAAAVVIEPLIQGAAGLRLWPKGMLAELRQLCDEADTFLILDEVMTGFGRTGTMFACEQEGVIPDFIALAKGLTGGYLPLAATLTTRRVYEQFLGEYEELKTFFYGHSYTANPLGCAAALANLQIFEEEKTLDQLPPKIQLMAQRLAALEWTTRQCGFIAGIDLVKPSGEAFDWREQTGARVCLAARRHGLLTRPIRDTIVLMPPYCVTADQLHGAFDALEAAIAETLGA
ncbi:MAG TPA: adenosylmethionine--8-amino-7-oxononanoate transaminase [Chthoniobacterales bacterium]